MSFWTGVLYGGLASIIITPIVIVIISSVKMMKMKLKIINALKSGNFLEPLDVKDYDSSKWDNIIDINKNKILLDKFKQKYDKVIPEDKRE